MKIEINNKKLKWGILVILIILFIASNVIFLIPIPYTAVEAYDEQVPYDVQEVYYEEVPYSTTEEYIEWVDSYNCNSDSDCYCRHYSWGGLGACDSCKCYRERTVTEYNNVRKYRTVTKYETVLREKRVDKKATLYQMWSGQVKYYYKV